MSKRQNKSSAVMIENLEERRMMSVSHNVALKELTVQGGTENNSIRIWAFNGTISVDVADATRNRHSAFTKEQVTTIRVYGHDGNDVIRLMGDVPRTYCYGGNGDDALIGAGVVVDASIVQSFSWFGGEGNDAITGTPLYDAIYGQGDNDIVSGGAHQDAIFGGEGSDRLYGGDGNDRLYGGDGNDFLYGENGDDWMYGENGIDVMYGGANNDVLNGGYGTDWMYGDDGIDFFEARDGEWDYMVGGAGNDHAVDRDHGDFFMQ